MSCSPSILTPNVDALAVLAHHHALAAAAAARHVPRPPAEPRRRHGRRVDVLVGTLERVVVAAGAALAAHDDGRLGVEQLVHVVLGRRAGQVEFDVVVRAGARALVARGRRLAEPAPPRALLHHLGDAQHAHVPLELARHLLLGARGGVAPVLRHGADALRVGARLLNAAHRPRVCGWGEWEEGAPSDIKHGKCS